MWDMDDMFKNVLRYELAMYKNEKIDSCNMLLYITTIVSAC